MAETWEDYGGYDGDMADPADYHGLGPIQRSLPLVFVGATIFALTLYLYAFTNRSKYKQAATQEAQKEALAEPWKDDGDDGGTVEEAACADPTGAAILSCMLANNPPGRIGGGVVFNEQSGDVCLYGGLSEKGFLDDEHVYDHASLEWAEMTASAAGGGGSSPASSPGARAFHGMVWLGSVVIVYGGATRRRRTYKSSEREETYDPAVYVLALEDGEWFAPPVAGDAPPPRAGATMSLWRDEALVVFGGRSASGLRNDSWVLGYVESHDSFWGTPRVLQNSRSAVKSNSFPTILGPSVLAPRVLDDWRESCQKFVPEHSS